LRPLEGITVLDFSTLLPGPLASLILSEAGANVIKIERPGSGEEMRGYEPRWGDESVNFALLNRGKKSLALDLKKEDDRRLLEPLLSKADILIEQFRPGVMKRLGLDYDTVSAINPGIIYCSITGYGNSGPKRDAAGHDLNYVGDTGLLNMSMGSAQGLVLPPALIADIAGGTYPAVMNIMFALFARQRSGQGRWLDIAMTDNLFTFMYWAIGNGLAAGQWPGNGTDLVTGGTPRYRLWATKDSRVVAAAPIEQKFWDVFCDLIDLPSELRDDTRDPAATAARIGQTIASQPAAHWRDLFAGKDCCCTVVADLKEALNDPHFAERGLFTRTVVNESGDKLPALPVPVDNAFRGQPEELVAAPGLGAHNKELLGASSPVA
jgi:alpha-methylacyl-CoA racemase